MKRGNILINLKNKQVVKESVPEAYVNVVKNYVEILEILNKSGNLIKEGEDYFTIIDEDVLYKVILSVCNYDISCVQTEYSLNGINTLFEKSGIEIKIPKDVLYDVELDMSFFMTKSEMLEIVDYLDDINHKLLIMASWEKIYYQWLHKVTVASILTKKYGKEFKSLVESIDDDRKVLIPIVPGKIISEFRDIDKIINKQFSKRTVYSKIVTSRLAYDISLDKKKLKRWTERNVDLHTKKSNSFDLYHVCRGLYQGEKPTPLKDILKKGDFPYLDLKIDDIAEENDSEEISENIDSMDSKKSEYEGTDINDNGKDIGKNSTTLQKEVLREKAKKAPKTAKVSEVTTKVYVRDEYVAEYAKMRANGICQLCEEEAPFKDQHGKPYLESHHIDWLSEGGEDSIENTVALCPNCHKKMHVLNLDSDVAKLKEKAKLS